MTGLNAQALLHDVLIPARRRRGGNALMHAVWMLLAAVAMLAGLGVYLRLRRERNRDGAWSAIPAIY